MAANCQGCAVGRTVTDVAVEDIYYYSKRIAGDGPDIEMEVSVA
jgi:hypothetical protein